MKLKYCVLCSYFIVAIFIVVNLTSIVITATFVLTGDAGFLEIDQYGFPPGSRVLTVRFNLTTGEEGTFQTTFEGLIRQRTSNYYCPLVIRLSQ